MSRTVIISGASRGLGLSLTRRFLQAGDRVFGISKTQQNWKTALATLPNHKNLSFHVLDLTQESQVQKFVRIFKVKASRVDILINNAGYGGRLMRTEDHSLDEFERHLSVNLISAFLMCKYFIPIFRNQKQGMILNISSMAGKRAVPNLAGYSASKFGILALTQAIAKENTDIELKCVTVCPGGMNTQMRADLFGEEDAAKQQTTDFVADKIIKIADGEIPLVSGSDIVIRHNKITAVDIPPNS